MKFRASGHGRAVGAIGIRHYFTCEVEAKDEADARLRVYEHYEHISGLRVDPAASSAEKGSA